MKPQPRYEQRLACACVSRQDVRNTNHGCGPYTVDAALCLPIPLRQEYDVKADQLVIKHDADWLTRFTRKHRRYGHACSAEQRKSQHSANKCYTYKSRGQHNVHDPGSGRSVFAIVKLPRPRFGEIQRNAQQRLGVRPVCYCV